MEIKAVAKSVRISPRKVRLVADMVRHLSIENALFALKASPKRASISLAKTINSAIANAVNNAGLDRNNLIIDTINITEGVSIKRFRPSTRGRTHPYKKRSSHIRIILKTNVSKVSKKAVSDTSSVKPEPEKKITETPGKTENRLSIGLEKVKKIIKKPRKGEDNK